MAVFSFTQGNWLNKYYNSYFTKKQTSKKFLIPETLLASKEKQYKPNITNDINPNNKVPAYELEYVIDMLGLDVS